MANDDYNFDWDQIWKQKDHSVRASNTRQPAITTEDIEVTTKCEFIKLNGQTNLQKLVTSEGFEAQRNRLHGLSDESNSVTSITDERQTDTVPIVIDNDVFVVSLLGDTGNGKSFLADHLLPAIEKNRPIVIEEKQRKGSTTANIMCFESTSFSPELSQTDFLLLDYEGEHGSYPPYMLRNLNEQWTSERAEIRRQAVSEYFPKLAYTISNIIILLSRDDFSNSEYISRCYDFAERATKHLQHVLYKPVLILVHNCSSPNMLQPIKEVTQQFFEMHHEDAKKLRQFFDAVYCMRLPYKINEMSNASEMSDPNQMFSNQIIGLKKLIVHVYKNHQKERTLPHISWLDIISLVIDIISKNRTIMMHMLLRQVLVKDPGDIEKNTLMFLFTILYKKRDIHTPRWFHFCRTFVVHVLARAIAIRFKNDMKFIPDSNMKNMTIKEEARICLEKLWTWLDEFRPCVALYMGEGYPTEKDHPVFCYQHKGTHQEHRTSEEVHGVPLLHVKFLKIPGLWSVHDVWSGQFEPGNDSEEVPTEQMHTNFYTDICAYITAFNNSTNALDTSLDRLLHQYDINIDQTDGNYCHACCFCLRQMNSNSSYDVLFHKSPICRDCKTRRSVLLRPERVEKLLPPPDDENECVICMAAPRIIMFAPCHHQRFCKKCADRIYEQFKKCPLCRTNITQVITPR